MMNHFIFFKVASKLFLHYETMFFDIKIRFCGMRMVSFKNCFVTSSHACSTFPKMTVFSELNRKRPATVGAKFGFIIRINEIFFTILAFFYDTSNTPSRRKRSLPVTIFRLFDSFWKFIETHNRTLDDYSIQNMFICQGDINGL